MESPPPESPNTPVTPSVHKPLSLNFTFCVVEASGKVVCAITESPFLQILFGLLSFPISSLSHLKIGTIKTICDTILTNPPEFDETFDLNLIFKSKPSSHPLPDPSVIQLMKEFCLPVLREPAARKANTQAEGGFVKHSLEFIIEDDLKISIHHNFGCFHDVIRSNGLSLLEVKLEKIEVNEYEVFMFIKTCLSSKNSVLTEWYKIIDKKKTKKEFVDEGEANKNDAENEGGEGLGLGGFGVLEPV